MSLSERDKVMILRGISMTRGVIKALRPECYHNPFLLDWQNALAEGWGMNDKSEQEFKREAAEFIDNTQEVTAAIRKVHPDYLGFIGRLRGQG